VVGGGNCAERDLTLGRRERGDCRGSIFGLVSFAGPGITMTALESEAAMAARADAERSDDARGGGSGGACPSDTKDVDDVALLSAAGSSDTDDDDDDLLSVACPSDTRDVDDGILSADPPSEASDVDETIF